MTKNRWYSSNIVEREDGTVIHSQRNSVGYGRSYYNIVGTFDGVQKVVDGIYKNYPTGGYGTSINWPPDRRRGDGSVFERNAPEIVGKTEDGVPIWWLTCNHSESCD